MNRMLRHIEVNRILGRVKPIGQRLTPRCFGLALIILWSSPALFAQAPTLPRPTAGGASPSDATSSSRSEPSASAPKPAPLPASNGLGSAPRVVPSSYGDYKLSPSDVIEVQVEDAPELSGNYRVNQEGSIPMKFLGSLPVVGRTTEEVATMVASGLRGRYLRNPQVYVAVRQYNSRTFFIQGAVRSPGVYVIEERPSLFKLITVAGGLVERHAPTAFIIRESRPSPEKLERARAGLSPADSTPDAASPDEVVAKGKAPTEIAKYTEQLRASRPVVEGETEYELITAQISGLFRGNFEQNLVIQPNDLVYIPPAEVFFVAGEVKSPGQFPLREGTTLRQAISLAQGTLFNAAANRTIIFRQDPLTGKLEEMLVDVAAVMSGKHEDVGIMPNDVIMIPNSRLKTVGGSLARGMGMGIAQMMLWTIFR